MKSFFLDYIIDSNFFQFNLLELLIISLMILFSLFSIKIFDKIFKKKLHEKVDFKVYKIIKLIYLLIFVSVIFSILIKDFTNQEFINYWRLLIKPFSIILITFIILVTLLINRLVRIYFSNKNLKSKKIEKKSLFAILSIVWLISISFILKTVIIDFEQISDFVLINIKDIPITPTDIFYFFFISVITSLIIIFANQFINKQVENGRINIGTSAAISQVLKYFLWVSAIAISLQIAGFKLSILLAGSAALLVGLGMGIKEIFSDIASGFILLIERTVIVGDIVEVNGVVGKIKHIGIRTTTIITRDNTWIIVPNSKFTYDNVINWSHIEKNTRFNVSIGVAYGSDVELVMKVLKECALAQKSISKNPEPNVLFENFNDFSLDFNIYFWTSDAFNVNQIKSDIRILIDKKFKEHNISIPFPVRTVQLLKED